MAAEKTDVLLIGPAKPVIVKGLAGPFNLIKFSEAKDRETFFAETAPRVRGIAVAGTDERVNGRLHAALSAARDRRVLRRRLRPRGRRLGGCPRHHRHQHARTC